MIHIDDEDRDIVLDIVKKEAPECEVRVFGSRYRGTHWRYSDLDLVFVGNGKLESGRIGDIKYAFEESDLPFRVDVLDWHAIPENFRESINAGYEVLYRP